VRLRSPAPGVPLNGGTDSGALLKVYVGLPSSPRGSRVLPSFRVAKVPRPAARTSSPRAAGPGRPRPALSQQFAPAGASPAQPGGLTGSGPVRPRRLYTRVYGLQYRVMKFLRSRRFARIASLVAAVTLLCLGAFLSWSATGVPASLTTAGSPHVDQGANGYGHAIDGNYLAAFAEEASDKLPANATLLTALLLVVFFGTAWLLAFGWTHRRSQVPSLIGCCFPSIGRRHQRRPVAALLEVFRL
jgi:hypothetical protein